MSAMVGKMAKALGKVVGGEEVGKRTEEEFTGGTSQPLISKTQRTISGLEAIEVVLNTPVSAIEVYIRKGDEVITVAFRAPKEEFSQYEASFRKSIESIEIR